MFLISRWLKFGLMKSWRSLGKFACGGLRKLIRPTVLDYHGSQAYFVGRMSEALSVGGILKCLRICVILSFGGL